MKGGRGTLSFLDRRSVRAGAAFSTLVLNAFLASTGTAQVLGVDSDPSPLVLTAGASATISVHLGPSVDAPVRFAASIGILEAAPGGAPGTSRYLYRPPPTRYPQTAVLAFWSAPAFADLKLVRLPLHGRTELTAKTLSGAEVRATVAGRSFGPGKADATGKVAIPIEVPPGVFEAAVFASTPEQRMQRTVRLTPPPPDASPPLALSEHEVLRPGDATVLLVAGGQVSQSFTLSVSGATNQLLDESPLGIQRWRLTAAPGAQAVKAEIIASQTGPALSSGRVSARLSARIEEPQAPKPPAPPTPSRRARLFRVAPALAAGGFYSAASPLGATALLGLGIRLPVLDERLFIDLDAGIRTWAPESRSLTDVLQSELLALPIELSLRGIALDLDPWSLALRGGFAVLPFSHSTRSQRTGLFVGNGVGFAGILGAQLSRAFGWGELFVDLRAPLGVMRAERLELESSGVSFCLGARLTFARPPAPPSAGPPSAPPSAK